MKDRATGGRGAVQFYSHLPGIRRSVWLAQTRAHYFRISSFFCPSFSPFARPMKCLVLSAVAVVRPLFLPLLSFFTCPVGTEPLLSSHMAKAPPSSFQKPARILSALFIHHCHCFYLRKTTNGAADRARPLIFLSTPLTSSSSLRAGNTSAAVPHARELLAPHVTAKKTPLRNLLSQTPFSLSRAKYSCEISWKMREYHLGMGWTR